MQKTLFLTVAGLLSLGLVAGRSAEQPDRRDDTGTLLLTAARTSAPMAQAASPNPRVRAAQTILNQTNQGRACTTLTRKSFPDAMKGLPEYQKQAVLVRHGLATVRHTTESGVKMTYYTLKRDIPESKGNGVFIPDGPLLYYCFGRWQATAVQYTDKFPVAESQRAAIVTVELRGAPAWIRTDPQARILAERTEGLRNDPAFLGSLNEYDKIVPPSFTVPNLVPFALPKAP